MSARDDLGLVRGGFADVAEQHRADRGDRHQQADAEPSTDQAAHRAGRERPRAGQQRDPLGHQRGDVQVGPVQRVPGDEEQAGDR